MVISLIQLKIIKKEHFTTDDRSGYLNRLTSFGFKLFVRWFEKSMSTEFTGDGKKKTSFNQYLDYAAAKIKASLKFGMTYSPRLIR